LFADECDDRVLRAILLVCLLVVNGNSEATHRLRG